MIKEKEIFITADRQTINSLPERKKPKFTVEGIKDGKTVKLTWIAGYFEHTGNAQWDEELDNSIKHSLTLPTYPVCEPRSPILSVWAPLMFFDNLKVTLCDHY